MHRYKLWIFSSILLTIISVRLCAQPNNDLHRLQQYNERVSQGQEVFALRDSLESFKEKWTSSSKEVATYYYYVYLRTVNYMDIAPDIEMALSDIRSKVPEPNKYSMLLEFMMDYLQYKLDDQKGLRPPGINIDYYLEHTRASNDTISPFYHMLLIYKGVVQFNNVHLHASRKFFKRAIDLAVENPTTLDSFYLISGEYHLANTYRLKIPSDSMQSRYAQFKYWLDTKGYQHSILYYNLMRQMISFYSFIKPDYASIQILLNEYEQLSEIFPDSSAQRLEYYECLFESNLHFDNLPNYNPLADHLLGISSLTKYYALHKRNFLLYLGKLNLKNNQLNKALYYFTEGRQIDRAIRKSNPHKKNSAFDQLICYIYIKEDIQDSITSCFSKAQSALQSSEGFFHNLNYGWSSFLTEYFIRTEDWRGYERFAHDQYRALLELDMIRSGFVMDQIKSYPDALLLNKKLDSCDYLLRDILEFDGDWIDFSHKNLKFYRNPSEIDLVVTAAKLNWERGKITQSLPYYQASKHLFELSIHQLIRYIEVFQSEISKIEFSDRIHHIFLQAINEAIDLYTLDKSPENLDYLFQLIQTSKSLILSERLRFLQHSPTHATTSSMIHAEYDLKSRVKQITRMQSYDPNFKVESITQIDSAYDALIARIQKEQKAYFDLFYDYSSTSVDLIQSKLKDDEQIIEYVVLSNTSIGIVSIDHTNTHFFVKQVSNLDSIVEQYQHLISATESSTDLDKLWTLSADLYRLLLLDIEPLRKKLIILPSGILEYISFDMLIKDNDSTNEKRRLPRYIIEDHIVSYHYNSHLWYENEKQPYRKFNVLGIAPTYPELKMSDSDEIQRAELFPLIYNRDEIEQIYRWFNGAKLMDKYANKQAIFDTIARFNAVHFASHAIMDPSEPFNSYLALSLDSTTSALPSDTNRIYLRDLYSRRIPMDMVVLSACNTGIGKLNRGEGLMSIARGFGYAGAQSVIPSLWAVSDGSTAQIMNRFYYNLKMGQSKDEALRNAKLNYLRNAEGMTLHPYYWSALIPIGNMSSITGVHTNLYYWLFAIILLIVFGWFGRQKRRS